MFLAMRARSISTQRCGHDATNKFILSYPSNSYPQDSFSMRYTGSDVIPILNAAIPPMFSITSRIFSCAREGTSSIFAISAPDCGQFANESSLTIWSLWMLSGNVHIISAWASMLGEGVQQD